MEDLLKLLKMNKDYFEIDLNRIKDLIRKNQLIVPKHDNLSLSDVIEDDEELLLYIEKIIEESLKLKASARVINYPTKDVRKPDQLRSDDINKLRMVEGKVVNVDSIRPLCTSAKFECPNCGNICVVLQCKINFKKPNRCGCGRNGSFKELSREVIDSQVIGLDINKKDVLSLLFEGDLVNNNINLGSQIKVLGFVKIEPYIYNKGESRFGCFQIKVNNIV